MAHRLLQLLFLLGTLCCLVRADQPVIVDCQDQSIQYHTVQTSSTNATWTVVQRSPDICDTDQMLTSRLGDYMVFTFTGTSVQVVGTIGVKRGLIEFALDGQNDTLKDRSAPKLACDSLLWEKSGLPNQQHTIKATLVGQEINYSSGQEDGVLSIQRIRYTMPGGSSNVGAIAGGVVGGIVGLAAVVVGTCWFIRRRRRRNQEVRRGTAGAFIDSDDVPHQLRGGKPDLSPTTSPGLIATPFEWNGPGSQYGHSPVISHPDIAPTTEAGALVTPPTANGPPSSYFHHNSDSSAGVTNNYSMSSSGDWKRESNLAGTAGVTAALGYSVTHPDSPETTMAGPRNTANPGGEQRSSSVIDDTHLVDRIANRLADIMTTRTGGVGVLDHIVPPPVYTGPRGPGNPSAPPQGGSQPPANIGSPGTAQTALPFPRSDARVLSPAQLPSAQYSYQSPTPPPKDELYPGSNRL